MKYLLALLAITMATADKLDNTYLPPSNAQSAAGGGAGLQTPRGGGGAPQFRGAQAPRGFSGGQGQGQGPQGYSGGQSPQGYSGGQSPQGQHGGQSPQGSGVGAPYSGGQGGQGQSYGGQGQGFGGQSQGQQGQGQGGSGQNQAEILRFENEQNEEGYHYAYETSDGTKAEQQGRNIPGAQPEEGSLQVQGSYSYIGDDGQTYSVTYTADENGFRAEGAHLPTPPPIPEAILKSLELTAGGGGHGGAGGAGGAGQGAGGPQSQYGSPKSSYDSDAGAGYQYK